MLVRDVMSQGVEVVQIDASVRQAAVKMRKRNVGPLPVCKGKQLVGILTDRDIVVREVAKGHDPKADRVGDVMTSEVYYCYDHTDVRMAAEMMKSKQVRRLVVVDHDKRLLGMLSLADLVVKADEQLAGATLERISEPAE